MNNEFIILLPFGNLLEELVEEIQCGFLLEFAGFNESEPCSQSVPLSDTACIPYLKNVKSRGLAPRKE